MGLRKLRTPDHLVLINTSHVEKKVRNVQTKVKS